MSLVRDILMMALVLILTLTLILFLRRSAPLELVNAVKRQDCKEVTALLNRFFARVNERDSVRTPPLPSSHPPFRRVATLLSIGLATMATVHGPDLQHRIPLFLFS
jgi:hypothetical protein